MSWGTLTPAAAGKFAVAPAGSHGACLVAIVDLGTQEERKYQSQGTEDVHKVLLVWELTGCPEAGTSNNHLIAEKLTFSLNEKAKLRQIVRQWRGKDIVNGEDFDLLKMLGKKCLVTVLNDSKGDKVYASFGGISGVPQGMAVADPKRRPFDLHILSDDPPPDWLPRVYGEEVAEVRARSKERKDRLRAKAAAHVEAAKAQSPMASARPFQEVVNAGRLIPDDSIPF